MSLKLIAILLAALVAAAGAGWIAGASGRSAVERDRNRTEIRAEFAEARAFVLDGRVSVFLSNFGDAVARFQRARDAIGRVQVRLRESGLVEQAGRLEIALSQLSDAQRASAAFQAATAQRSAEAALQTLDAAAHGG